MKNKYFNLKIISSLYLFEFNILNFILYKTIQTSDFICQKCENQCYAITFLNNG